MAQHMTSKDAIEDCKAGVLDLSCATTVGWDRMGSDMGLGSDVGMGSFN